MKTSKAIKVSSVRFTNYYGHAPKGWGLWAFDIIDSSCNKVVETWFPGRSSTLSDARKLVKEYVKENYSEELATGYLDIEVAT